MPLLANAQMTVSAAPGTGSLQLAAAVPGAQSWAAAGAESGAVYSYRIEEGAAWECGVGSYDAAGPTLSRSAVLASSGGGSAVNFGAGAIVSQVVLPADIVAPGIGDLVQTLGVAPPYGCLKLNGALIARATYAGLWAWVQASASLVADSAWLGGATASFSTGDGSTNFRLPDFRGEMVRYFDDGRGLDSGRSIGTIQAQNLPNHAHTTPLGFDNQKFYGWLGADDLPVTTSQVIAGAYRLTASGVYERGMSVRTVTTDGTARSISGELRPRNVSILACIRYK